MKVIFVETTKEICSFCLSSATFIFLGLLDSLVAIVRVHLKVLIQVCFLRKCLSTAAQRANEGSLSRVAPYVVQVIVHLPENQLTALKIAPHKPVPAISPRINILVVLQLLPLHFQLFCLHCQHIGHHLDILLLMRIFDFNFLNVALLSLRKVTTVRVEIRFRYLFYQIAIFCV